MKDSYDNLEPMKMAGGSAFSRRKKAEIAEQGVSKRNVNVGALPKDHYAKQ